ncbi:MAG TPA: heavy-metal-associated domain-containing protein, partial [Gammaproteobacteria bacterium]|nr:heavy-metal-associated domain-containing protein [Gammaproteobacteria bacterium]
MQCSFCVSSIKKALTQMDGVKEVGISLAHEEALVQYDPDRVAASELRDTLCNMGYTIRDPRKVRG